jgi:hypothetical protein
MAKVEAPNKEYNGPGSRWRRVRGRRRRHDDEAALNYYRSAGYKVSGKVESPVESPEPPDPREVTRRRRHALRDAAVDPEPSDFLAPVNAGEANPHGSEVVSPEIHASGPSGIRPGEVFVEDVDKQEKREKEFAQARLVENVHGGRGHQGRGPRPRGPRRARASPTRGRGWTTPWSRALSGTRPRR